MTFRRVYSEEQRGFRPLKAPPNVRLQINNEVLFIDKVSVLPSQGCARLQVVRSIVVHLIARCVLNRT
jgi:hypothetical protein